MGLFYLFRLGYLLESKYICMINQLVIQKFSNRTIYKIMKKNQSTEDLKREKSLLELRMGANNYSHKTNSKKKRRDRLKLERINNTLNN